MVRRLSAYLRKAMKRGCAAPRRPPVRRRAVSQHARGHERVRRLYGIANGAEAEARRTGRIVDCFLRAFGAGDRS